MDPPSEEEWHHALQQSKLSTASGISGIGYRLIKHAPSEVHKTLRHFVGLTFVTTLVPFQWKLSQLYPIPKPQEWKFNLSNTQPILLLECMRKLAMKVVTTRLSSTCSQYNILKGPNFVGLKGILLKFRSTS